MNTMKEKRKIILVANSPYVFDIKDRISKEDLIARFNLPEPSTLAPTGNKTDFIFLANTVDVIQKKMRPNSNFFQFTQSIEGKFKVIFSYSDNLIQQINPFYKKRNFLFFKKLTKNFNNVEYIQLLESLENDFLVLPEHYYLDLKNKIDPDTKTIISTGLIATHYFLNDPKYQDFDVYLHGFSFEGWHGHAWDKEKQYIQNLIDSNNVHLFNN